MNRLSNQLLEPTYAAQRRRYLSAGRAMSKIEAAARLVVLIVLTTSICGCCGAIRVDGSTVAPSQDVKAVVVGRSAPCESFAQRGPKDFYLSVVRVGSDPPQYLFKSHVKLVATWPDWTIRWNGPNEVEFAFYSSPSENERVRPEVEGSEKFIISTIRIRRAEGEPTFHE